jgi:hypothetical protein
MDISEEQVNALLTQGYEAFDELETLAHTGYQTSYIQQVKTLLHEYRNVRRFRDDFIAEFSRTNNLTDSIINALRLRQPSLQQHEDGGHVSKRGRKEGGGTRRYKKRRQQKKDSHRRNHKNHKLIISIPKRNKIQNRLKK